MVERKVIFLGEETSLGEVTLCSTIDWWNEVGLCKTFQLYPRVDELRRKIMILYTRYTQDTSSLQNPEVTWAASESNLLNYMVRLWSIVCYRCSCPAVTLIGVNPDKLFILLLETYFSSASILKKPPPLLQIKMSQDDGDPKCPDKYSPC